MDLATRALQVGIIHDRVKMSMTKALTDILRTQLSTAATDALKRELRARQRWAKDRLADPALSGILATMVAAGATDVQIDNGLTDAEIDLLVGIGVDALAAVAYEAPNAAVPA